MQIRFRLSTTHSSKYFDSLSLLAMFWTCCFVCQLRTCVNLFSRNLNSSWAGSVGWLKKVLFILIVTCKGDEPLWLIAKGFHYSNILFLSFSRTLHFGALFKLVSIFCSPKELPCEKGSRPTVSLLPRTAAPNTVQVPFPRTIQAKSRRRQIGSEGGLEKRGGGDFKDSDGKVLSLMILLLAKKLYRMTLQTLELELQSRFCIS